MFMILLLSRLIALRFTVPSKLRGSSPSLNFTSPRRRNLSGGEGESEDLGKDNSD
jgi:hypothetical protein